MPFEATLKALPIFSPNEAVSPPESDENTFLIASQTSLNACLKSDIALVFVKPCQNSFILALAVLTNEAIFPTTASKSILPTKFSIPVANLLKSTLSS